MTGKKTVFIIILFTIIVLILAWFWLQHVIKEYDLDTATATANFIAKQIKTMDQ